MATHEVTGRLGPRPIKFNNIQNKYNERRGSVVVARPLGMPLVGGSTPGPGMFHY